MSGRQWNRERLVALNACRELSREAVCSLAAAPCSDLLSRRRERPPDGLARLRFMRPATLKSARRAVSDAAARSRAELRRAEDVGAVVVTLADPGYPAALLDLDLPPPVLYLRGAIPSRPAIAIVGSRRADAAGLEAAGMFGRELARAGATVVSGLARGVDTAAHRGALEARGGRTVGVLGCGLDVPYPRGRRPWVGEMSRRGAVVSEFPLGAPPLPHHFPIRNRVIAALALGTLVVQAAPRSGSLITARLALELGRDVYAIPGGIFDRRSLGTNALIRDGALLVQRPRDVLESLPLGIRDRLEDDGVPDRNEPTGPDPGGAPPPSAVADRLLEHLEPGVPRTADELARRAGLGIEETLAGLLELELSRSARRHPGPSFCLSTDRIGPIR